MSIAGSAIGLRLATCAATAAAAAGCSPLDTPDESSAPPLARSEFPLLHAPDARSAGAQLLGTRTDLRLVGVRHSLTGEHVRYQQLAPDGSEVVDGEVSVHLTGAAPGYRLTRVWDRPATLQLTGSRALGEAQAQEAALAAARTRGAAQSYALAAFAPAALASTADARLLRAGWRARVATTRPVHLWDVWIDGETGAATIRRDLVWHAEGTAMVYLPNPVTSSGDLGLADNDDATSAALDAARVMVTLERLDGSGNLEGDYVDVVPAGVRINKTDLSFVFDRSEDQFEEVNAYYHIDGAQAFLQSLGFTGEKAILAVPFRVEVNSRDDDNSFYSSAEPKHIETGTGGVDDAEDGDVLHHEYGHALQDDMLPGFGSSEDGGALGEGFGDLLAASLPVGGPVRLDRACLAPWDATSYSHTDPPCLRRVDGVKHHPEGRDFEVHDDGEIWSGAMWDLFEQTGLGPEEGIRLVIEAFFSVQASVTFAQYSEALIAADVALYDGAHVDTIERVLWRHGLLRRLMAPGELVGGTASTPIRISRRALGDNLDEEVVISQPGATAIRLHFSSFEMEVNRECLDGHCDNVYLYDGEGRLYAILGGNRGAFNAPVVPGDTVLVRWLTDGNFRSEGFSIDRYDWAGSGKKLAAEEPGCGCRAGRARGAGERASSLLLLALAAFACIRRRTLR